MPLSPEQIGMVGRLIRTLREQRIHRYRFASLQHPSRVVSDWVAFYNQRRPRQALGMRTPQQAYLAA